MALVTKASMKSQVYEIIKRKILDGECPPGSPLNIVALSKELGVSNTPIREAFSMLQANGLVTSSMNTKVRVIEITEDLSRETNRTLLVLTSGSYDLVTYEKREDSLISMLEASLKAQESALAVEDNHKFIEAAIDFDRCFIEVNENPHTKKSFDEIAAILFILTRYNYAQDGTNRDENIKQHYQIFQAVKEKDSAKVHQLLFRHYDKHIN